MMAKRMPAIFFGHGNPMNAILENEYTRAWNSVGTSIPRPKAILSISAHWYIPGTFVTAMQTPPTIHDFGGFPKRLYEVEYPAPGDPGVAQKIKALLTPYIEIDLDHSEWGLDHGTWSVLHHVYPEADIPVIQLSIDETKPPAWHYELGQRLAPLRDEDILVMGSGDVVHNLHTYAWGRHSAGPFDWAVRFENKVRELILAKEHGPLIDYESLGKDAILSVPFPDHYLPLLYILGLQKEEDQITFPVEGMDGGSVSMLAIQFS